jgi:L-amino acid N-acyltransferase
MTLVECTFEAHGLAILEILNEAILTSTALYDYSARPPEAMVAWFDTKSKGNFPVIGAVDETGFLMGFASYGTFRPFPAYKYSVEHSVYVHKRFRGRGASTLLMQALIARATRQNYHVLVGCIDATNEVSIKLHEKLGFTYSGTIRQAGFKFGHWLDATFYQKILASPERPTEP